MTLEISLALMQKVKSNPSILSIFRQSLATLYKSYRNELISSSEYQTEYNNLLYKCSLLAE